MTASVTYKQRRKLRAPKFALALPSIIWYTLFFVVPIAFIVVYSFGAKDGSKLLPVDLSNLSGANYANVFDETFFKVFKSTLRISTIATIACLLIGLPVAYLAAFKVSEKWKGLILALVVVPSFTSFLIRTVAWRIPLAPNGFFSKWLVEMSWIGPQGIQVLETPLAVQIAIIYNYLGFMILPLFVALDRIDVRMREASKDLGAGRLSTFFSVTLPLAGPGIIAGVLLTFIPMCGDYVTATILGGAKGNMIGSMIASQFSGAQNWPLGSAMAVLMIGAVLLSMVVGAAIVWLVSWIVAHPTSLTISLKHRMYERSLVRSRAGKGSLLKFDILPYALWAWAVLVRFAVIVAIALVGREVLARKTSISKRALNWAGPGAFFLAFIVNGALTDSYRGIFDFAGVGDAIRNSFIAAFGATVIAVIIGGFAGVSLARRPGIWTKFFMATVFLILVTPEIMDAIALATWFPRIADFPIIGYPFKNGWGPFNGGMNKLWVGQSLYASAVVTLIVRARLAGLDESLEEAAADLGATPARAFRQITLPLISSALVAGGLLSFALCLDNAVISTLVSEAGSTTFPVALIGATRSTIKPFWGVGAVLLFTVTLGALWFVTVVLKRSGSSSSEIAATLAGN